MAALSQEGDRFKRADLLLDIGTEALRLKFDKWLPQTKLQEKLQEVKNDMKRLTDRTQFPKLYPKYGYPKIHRFTV